uniref:Structural maintenance of chromosomes protein n=1 Tax=Glossina morsitans morsitans TaxID=37546 RepID=A0A1B0FFV3_GLOMM
MSTKRKHSLDNLAENGSNKRKVDENRLMSCEANLEVSETPQHLHAEGSSTSVTQDTPHDIDVIILEDEEDGYTYIDDVRIPSPIPSYSQTRNRGPRLIVKRIENDNFKSFAGKVLLGPFHHNFNAVLGPNGSGKSNLMDSILFVVGSRINTLRCKKHSTLIHNSPRYPSVDSCSVAVHFCQISDSEDGSCHEIPNSEFIVKRTALKKGSSFYSINGEKVQFNAVICLLKKHNINLNDNHFIALQGELETIALMKPKGKTKTERGMLEYLERIIGTDRYIEPLNTIMEHIEALTEESAVRHDLCELAKRAMEDLKQPYNEAIQYLKQKNENIRTKNLKTQKSISEKNKILESYLRQQDSLKQDLRECDSLTESLRREVETMKETAQKEIMNFESLNQKKYTFEQEKEKACKRFAETQQVMMNLNQMLNENKAQIKMDESKSVELYAIRDKYKQEVEEGEEQLKQIVAQKAELEEQLKRNYKQIEDQAKPFLEKRETLESELIKLHAKVDATKYDLSLLESELKILKYQEIHETSKYDSMRSFYEESQKVLNEKRTIAEELKENLLVIKSQAEEKLTTFRKLDQKQQVMVAQLMKVRAEINEIITIMPSMPCNDLAFDSLMRQNIEGKIPGILGRLGDLGAIDCKYDVAISTASDALDNIIVENADVAEKCIEYLRQNGLGRASFIPLENIKHLEAHSVPFQTLENVPRLYDLVHVEDKRILPAFYFVLRDTLVAADLEQGMRIAYGTKPHRVVTLNGEVIEISGLMSAGSSTQMRGNMGSKIQIKSKLPLDTAVKAQKTLEDLQTQAEQLQSEMNFNQEQQSVTEREMQQLMNTQQRLEIELQKILITTQSLERQLPYSFEQMEAQRTRLQQAVIDAQKVERIGAEIEIKKKTLTQAEDIAAEMAEKVIQIRNQIDSIYGNIQITVQNKINYLDDQAEQVNNNLLKIKGRLFKSERNINKIDTQIKESRMEIGKTQDGLTALGVERQAHDNIIAEFSQQIKEIDEDIDKERLEASAIYKEMQRLKKLETDSKLEKVDIEQKLQSVIDKISNLRFQITHCNEQLKSMSLQEIPRTGGSQISLKSYTEEELASYTLQDIQYKESLEENLLKNKPNLSCIDEYKEKRCTYLKRVKIRDAVICKCEEMRTSYENFRKTRHNGFMEGFQIISDKLKEIYRMLTKCGDAELELVDSMDPFEGVSFNVRPEKKTWRNISHLSGGEKALSTLALIFALHHFKPTPLYFMDEIDAVLDFQKLSIVANYLRHDVRGAQLLVITLRPDMSDLADSLVGIYKIRDCSESVCLRNIHPALPPRVTSTQQTQPQTNSLPTGLAVETRKMRDGKSLMVETSSNICRYPEKQNALSQNKRTHVFFDNNTNEKNDDNSESDVVDTTQTNLKIASDCVTVSSQDSLFVHQNASRTDFTSPISENLMTENRNAPDIVSLSSMLSSENEISYNLNRNIYSCIESSTTIDSNSSSLLRSGTDRTDNFQKEKLANRNIYASDDIIVIDSQTSISSKLASDIDSSG